MMKTLTEKDERLLAAYFDGELTHSERTKIESRLGSELIQALRAHQELQLELKSLVSTELSKSEELVGELDLWSKLEGEVRKISAEYGRAHENRETGLAGLFGRIFGGSPALRGSALAVAAIALLVGVNLPGAPVPDSDTPNLMLTKELFVDQALDERLQKLARVSFAPDKREPLAVPAEAMKSYRERILRAAEDDLGIPLATQVVNRDFLKRDFVLGGLRAGQTDFHLLDSERDVQLVSSGSADLPPTIWIKKRGESQRLSTELLVDTVSDLKISPEAVN